MRRLLLCALLVTGCGSAGELPAATPTIDMSQFGPRRAVARATPPSTAPAVRPRITPRLDAALRSGAIAVVGVNGDAGIRPAALETSSDASLEGLSWSSWSAGGASGSGEFLVQDCQPNCATGHTRRVAATVELNDVRTCEGRRYYGRAVVKLASGPAPTSYVRAPC
jgi:hypothetical protein